MKFNKFFILFLLILVFLFILLTSKVFASDVPDIVIEKARELNRYHSNDVIVLKDINSGDYYIPYCDNLDSPNWRYTHYNNIFAFICPGYHALECYKYSNNIFTKLNIRKDCNSINANCFIQDNFNNIKLVPIFADNPIVYYNVEGHENYSTFFPNPVQEVQEVVAIPVLEKVEELPQAMITTLKMILPAGLVVFGILLLVYIIRLLILRVT